MNLIVLGIITVALSPLFLRWHRMGVERYRQYDRLAFWNSLSEEDKESADWYMEGE